MLHFRGLFQLIIVAIALPISACSTALVNSNQTDLASTLDDLTVAQIVLNLIRTQQNPWAIPTQVQLNTSVVAGRTSISPSFFDPLGSTIGTGRQVAQSVTTTTTKTAPNQSATISLLAENTSSWNASPIQDPEALKRIQLLYQYATRFISASAFTCAYPIPRKPEKTDQKSDLQVIADLLKKSSTRSSFTEQDKSSSKELDVYVIGVPCFGSEVGVVNAREKDGAWIAAAENKPDLAFLTHPVCVLCQNYDEKSSRYLASQRIYLNNYSDQLLTFKEEDRKKIKRYVQVKINECLAPDQPEPGHVGGESYYKALIDWLFVLPDGAVPEVEYGPKETNCRYRDQPPRRIGGANGYSVYTTNDRKFSEFVLAVREATLQSPQIPKVGAPSTPLVQTVTGG